MQHIYLAFDCGQLVLDGFSNFYVSVEFYFQVVHRSYKPKGIQNFPSSSDVIGEGGVNYHQLAVLVV